MYTPPVRAHCTAHERERQGCERDKRKVQDGGGGRQVMYILLCSYFGEALLQRPKHSSTSASEILMQCYSSLVGGSLI